MNDYFYEDIIKRDHGLWGKLFPFVSYIAWAIFTFFFNYYFIWTGENIIYFTGLISFGLWYLVYRLNRNMKIEYEFSITNDNVSVTKIIGQKKRLDVANLSIRENADYIGPVTSDKFNEFLMNVDSFVNVTPYSPYKENEDTWAICYRLGGTNTILIFDFRPSMYKNFRRYNPRNVAAYTYPEGWDEEYDG